MKTFPSSFPHVVVVGAGFGGLRAARRLAGLPVRVTVIDRNNYHLFQPLLYQVASAGLSAGDIAFPVRSALRRQRNAGFLLAEVQQVDLTNRRLLTSAGEVEYDFLILAVGGQTHFFGQESLARHAFGLKTLADADGIRNHVLSLFERASHESDPQRRAAMLTFVVAGGGPSGVETAGALAELIRLGLSRDFPNLDVSGSRVVLLEAADHLLPAMPPDLQAAAEKVLRAKGVEVRLGARVDAYDGQVIELANGEKLPARTLIWAAGIRAVELVQNLPVEHGTGGRVRVLPTLQLPGFPEVFVIGDAALLEDERGKPLPMVAPVAMQQADTAVENLGRLLRGQPLQPFHYRDPGMLATIGRNQAVAQIGRLHLRGFIAWLMWVVVHVFQLIGIRNRLVVMINWVWDYFLYERALRLIQSPPSTSRLSGQEAPQAR
ncbi:NADH dehydrogenase, FAD-containing subunit [Bellilinea caldifistulae]|uniref:NADH:ubiquinone reductase (non-electrogenic) n=1 Tax=Bellilinea caldifistulae TaxID=360411 RepID=A0A0P6XD28_9CHLR|nr:NAD(P)/FAD-dependent oxidoreductase [Bellilinea caldifistulae]KPL78166.1 pyridine nucleotide-disulfide oxidoreductase [Bellilinea caldifistulae]GAP09270.1 NADH dehydrogenase, FAD-containing subunit [Bellilinea caldifistulae]